MWEKVLILLWSSGGNCLRCLDVHARIPLLQQFQQLVEVQESARILEDIANGNKHSGSSVVGVHGILYADLKDILETWRLRTPNEWDNLTVWYDLLQWRNEMYNAVIDAFRDFGTTNPQLRHLGYHDKAWNVNKLAHISHKQGLSDVCVSILEKCMDTQPWKFRYCKLLHIL